MPLTILPDHFAGNHPVGQIAFLIDLHRAKHAQINVTAANHGKRICAGKICGASHLTDGFLTGVDEISVFFALERIGANPQHAIFALQNHMHARRNVIRHKCRHANAEIHIKSIAQLARNALHNALALFNVFAGFCRQGHWFASTTEN